MASTCAHCERPTDDAAQHYCPQCGQPTPPHRIDWQFLGHELEHSVLHMDRGLLFTLRTLMLHPGRLLRDYIAGRRHGHVKPLLLISITAAAVVLAARGVQALHPQMGASLTGLPQASDGGAMAEFAVINGWMERHYALATLMLLPVEAACFRLAFARGPGLIYPEWLVVMAFVTVQTFMLQLVALSATAVWPHAAAPLQAGAMALSLLYGCVTLVGLFAPRPAWRVVIRSVVGYLLFAVASGGVIAAIGVAGVIARRLG